MNSPSPATPWPAPHLITLSELGGRRNQEDRVWPTPEQPFGQPFQLPNGDTLVVVADGAGGHEGGEIASQIVIEWVYHTYAERCQQGATPPQALRDAVHAAHRAVRQRQQEEPNKADMASTVVALAMRGSHLWIINVGDSRAYGYRSMNQFQQLSKDHTLVQQQVDAGNLSAERARVHPLRNRLAQALGGEDGIEPSLLRVDNLPGDRYLLCTDGLTDVMDDSLLHQALAGDWTIEEAAYYLAQQALRSAQDNVTLALLEIPDPAQVLAAAPPIEEQLSPHLEPNDRPARAGFSEPILATGLSATDEALFYGEEPRVGLLERFNRFIARLEQHLMTILSVLLGAVLLLAAWIVFFDSRISNSEAVIEGISGVVEEAISPAVTYPPTTATLPGQPMPTLGPTDTRGADQLSLDRQLGGMASTSTPLPSPTALPKIVEYYAGPNGVVFEPVPVQGTNTSNRCYKKIASGPEPLPKPTYEQENNQVIVIFEADGADSMSCGEILYDEKVRYENPTSEYPNGRWIIDRATMDKVIPSSSGTGWLILVNWMR